MSFDPVSQDAAYDSENPTSNSGLVIESAGAKLNGVMFHPSGAGLHPLILLLHGFPGHERNLDLAHVLRRAGWHVVVFHYRGAWGSGGDYRFAHALEDVTSVADYFRQVDVASYYRIDTSRIIAVGHSLGGWLALMALAHGVVSAAAGIASLNLGHWGSLLNADPEAVTPMMRPFLEENITPLAGVTSDDLMAELALNAEAWDYTQYIDSLVQNHLLLVAGKRDTVISPIDHHLPLVKALESAKAPLLRHTLMLADHDFSYARLALAGVLLDWLQTFRRLDSQG